LSYRSEPAAAAAAAEQDKDDPNRTLIENVAALPSALMYAAMFDQDTNCRFIGRCLHGAILDRKIGDMIPRDTDGEKISLDQNIGRRFLYARYNADLSREGLDAMGLHDIKPKNVQKLDSIEHIGDLRRVGKKVAEEIKIDHFGHFVS
jgi:hypothetical protein